MEDFWKTVSLNKDNIRFIQAKSFSPYSEFSKKWKKRKGDLCELTVNGLYRYDSIFEPLLSNKLISEDNKKWLFDIYMHYLVELEYRKGFTKQESDVRINICDILSGEYGEKNAVIFKQMNLEEQYYVANFLQKQKQNRESIYLFSSIIVKIMHNGVIYKDKENPKKLMYYINEKKDEEKEKKIEFIKDLFLPLGYEMIIFWEKHFAVLGYDQTMQIDEIELL